MLKRPLSTLVGLAFTLFFAGPGLVAQTSYDLLFIHHSVGYSWLVQGGLYMGLVNPNNLGGRKIQVHYATYGDEIGNNTDTCHWRTKFRDRMEKVLTFNLHPNVYYKNRDRFNQVVMFKSCFPNSIIPTLGLPPGDPDSTTRSLVNYMAVFQELSALFDDHPQTLFVYVTSPPRNVKDHWTRRGAANHRTFCRWVGKTWLPAYRARTGQSNVAVFDFFDILAEAENHSTAPNALKAAYAKGKDSHPQPPGLQAATKAFLPFLDRALTLWEKERYLGCAGQGRLTPWLHEKGRCRLGNDSYRLQVQRLPRGAGGVLAGGLTPSPLPLAGGCRLMVQPLLLFPYKAPAASTAAALILPVPLAPELIGNQLFFQSVHLASKGAFLDTFDFSNLLRVRIFAL